MTHSEMTLAVGLVATVVSFIGKIGKEIWPLDFPDDSKWRALWYLPLILGYSVACICFSLIAGEILAIMIRQLP